MSDGRRTISSACDAWRPSPRALVCCFVVLAVVPLTALAAEPVLVGIDAPILVAVGETFSVDVTVGPVAALDVAKFVVRYDPVLLEHIAAGASLVPPFGAGDASPGRDFPVDGRYEGSVEFPGTVGVDGEGPLMRLTFVARATGTTRISLDGSGGILVDGGGTIIPSIVGPAALVDAGVSPSFEHRSHWVFDPAPGGDGDGVANPGERVQPRIRLKNVGSGEARNVRVVVTMDDFAVTAEVAEVGSPAWPAGEARNNSGFVFLIAPGATPREARVRVDVFADNGGPWQFDVTFTVAYPPVFFAHRNDWVFDPGPGGNRDGVASPGETVHPRLRLTNLGAEAARNVGVTLSAQDPTVTVVIGHITHAEWPAGDARNNDGLLLEIGQDTTPRELTLRARVTADNGGPWEFTFVVAVVDLPSTFALRRHWTFDPDGNRNGQANAGERVLPRVRLLNEGPGVARNVRVSLTVLDPTITVVSGEVVHAMWPAGEARNNDGLMLDLAPRAASHATTVTVHVAADIGGPWEFTFDMQIVAAPVFSMRASWVYDPGPEGLKNGVADAGERVFPRVRLRNDGAADAENVHVALWTDDPDIAVVAGGVSYAVWPAMSAGNNEGFVLDIATGASSHVASLTVTVTARDAGPWRFQVELPVAAAPWFSRRSFWAWDKRTGDGDGKASPGERVELRVRLRNEGAADAANVVVALASTDSAVTLVTGTVTHATWHAGDARNNVGLVVEVGPTAADSATFTVDVTADNGGPWRFTYTLPIVPRVKFARRSVWTWDRNTGDADGVAEPGEQVELRVRLKNEGGLDGANVVVTVGTSDPNATVSSPTVTHPTWPAGDARNNVGLVVDLGADVDASVDFVVDVTADNGGPWRFEFTLEVASVSAAPSTDPTSERPDRNGETALPAEAPTLLPNYPNPFNPETWIPFVLFEAADVAVTIYGMRGDVVRRIALGRRDRGTYRARGRAAYWDGRSDTGEPVTSGVYIYELHAAGHRAARRMVLRK